MKVKNMNFSAILYTPREMTLSLLRRAVDSPKLIVASHGAENWARKKHCAKIEKKRETGENYFRNKITIFRLET